MVKKEKNKKKTKSRRKQQITTIRVFRGCRLVCFFFCINEQNVVDENEKTKREKREREKQQHIDLMFKQSSFESFCRLFTQIEYTNCSVGSTCTNASTSTVPTHFEYATCASITMNNFCTCYIPNIDRFVK